MKKWIMLATMLVTVLGVYGSALAQEVTEDTTTEETTAEETTTEDTATEDTATEDTATGETTTEDTTTEETTSEDTTTTEDTTATEDTTTTEETVSASPEFTLGADGFSVVGSDGTTISCFDAFREEQEELVVTGTLPTTASDAARACDGFGIANPYPAPYFYDTDGFLYTYDPIEGTYSAPDPATGYIYIYSPANGAFYTYDPVNGVYL